MDDLKLILVGVKKDRTGSKYTNADQYVTQELVFICSTVAC